LAATIAAVIGRLNIPSLIKLVKHGAPITATIIRTTCDSHNSAAYTFTVGSARYSGGDNGIQDCRSLHPGDQITIYYDLTDPALNRASEPTAALRNEIISISLAAVLIPTFALGAVLFRKRRKKP